MGAGIGFSRGGMIAFKEWEVVCEALASGRQTVIMRKGGIHEGREGFSFAYDDFLLFPTRFHAQREKVRVASGPPEKKWEEGDEVRIEWRVRVEKAITLTDWESVAALEDRHILTEEAVRERFDWAGKGMSSGSIHCAFVAVEKLPEPLVFHYRKKHGGCRSWVEVP